ncbi:MAG TPA: hypothetical protein VEA41_05730, partial [Salinarimonas sp.]|nr:hypothetical protein [Salinarimonas sp.]
MRDHRHVDDLTFTRDCAAAARRPVDVVATRAERERSLRGSGKLERAVEAGRGLQRRSRNARQRRLRQVDRPR